MTTNFSFGEHIIIDGKRYHKRWLRDNCLCSECRHIEGYDRLYDYTKNAVPVIRNANILSQTLSIEWDESPAHQSDFPLEWITRHQHDPLPRDFCTQPEQQLWDKQTLQKNPLRYFKHNECAEQEWLKELLCQGFTLFKGLPVDELESFIHQFGFLREGEYGRLDDLMPTPDASTVGYGTSLAFPPHCDSSYKISNAVLMVFYCVENTVKGGESIYVDGFKVVDDFRRDHPGEFKILCEVPVTYQCYHEQGKYYYANQTTVIGLNVNGRVDRICLSEMNVERSVPFAMMDQFYEAFANFLYYIKNPKYQLIIRFEAGDCMLFNNLRVLHSRRAFDVSSGARHYKVGHLDWDFITARWNYWQIRHFYK